jgi:glucan-binding YG repeat protein
VGSNWYYFASSGAMKTGWVKIGSSWYYFGESGAMVTGWQTINSKTYFFKNNGAMAASEWCGGYWLNADGTWTYPYKASWHQNDKGWWYGDPSGWYARNTTVVIDGKSYTFDASGKMV